MWEHELWTKQRQHIHKMYQRILTAANMVPRERNFPFAFICPLHTTTTRYSYTIICFDVQARIPKSSNSAVTDTYFNKPKRFANQLLSGVINALVCVYCYFLRAKRTGWRRTSYIGKLLTAADRCKKPDARKKFQPVENELLFFWGGPLACWHASHLQFCRLRYRKRYSVSNTLLKHKGWKLTTQIDQTISMYVKITETKWQFGKYDYQQRFVVFQTAYRTACLGGS